ADQLLKDQSPFWPTNPPLKSSNFVKQFAKDMLYAMFGLRNPVAEPLKFALLIELGEQRRAGNTYGPAEAAAAVAAFEEVYKKVPTPGAPPGAPPVGEAPPVGSPPLTTKPEHL